jgi:hypothetical protein
MAFPMAQLTDREPDAAIPPKYLKNAVLAS